MLSPGQLINGKYRLVRLIGEGGMGSVFEARHEVLGNRVALKFLHPEIASQPGLEQRFMQEARLSATMNDPHIVRVTDVDSSPHGAYLVMDLLQGEPLQSLIDREQRLDVERAIGFTLQILEALETAHAQGVVHRDLKPDNVFVTPGPHGPLLKLLDFGIAKIRASEEYQMTLTRPGAVMGTPEYMAPEQAYSADLVDQRSDIYAVGVMLFEMLSGSRPVDGETPQEIAEQTIKGQVRQLAALCPQLPGALPAIVHRAIAASPEQRWSSAREFHQALLPYAPNTLSLMPTPLASRAQPSVGQVGIGAPPGRVSNATGMATPFVAAAKTPPMDPAVSISVQMSSRAPDERQSTVPKTIPPDVGPPPATLQQPKAKTASMPEVSSFALRPTAHAVGPGTTAPGAHVNPHPSPHGAGRRKPKSKGWGWALVLVSLGAIGAFIWYAAAQSDSGLPPPPPMPKARTTDSPAQSGPRTVEPIDPPREDVEFPDPVRRKPPVSPPKKADPAPPPTLPTFQIPTNLPLPKEIPTSLPTTLPTAFPFPTTPPPADSRGTSPAPENPEPPPPP